MLKLSEGLYYQDINKEYAIIYNNSIDKGLVLVNSKVNNILKDFTNWNTVKRVADYNHISEEELMDVVEKMIEKRILIDSSEKVRKENPKRMNKWSFWMHITNDCNLRCPYCYVEKNRETMNFNTMKEAIDKIHKSAIDNNISIIHIKFAGGEPLMRFDFIKSTIDYIEKICSNSSVAFEYSLITNGVLLSEQILLFLREHNFSIGVSVDGTEEIHNKTRIDNSGKGTYSLTMQGIEKAISFGLKPFILITITENNIDSLLDLTKLMVEREYSFRFSLVRDVHGYNKLAVDKDNTINRLLQCIHYMQGKIKDKDFYFQFGDTNFTVKRKTGCDAGVSFFSINEQGFIGLCGMDLVNNSLRITDCNDIINNIRDVFSTELANTLSTECTSCVWSSACANGCKFHNNILFGNLNAQSIYCSLYKEVLPEVIKLKALQLYKPFIFRQKGE